MPDAKIRLCVTFCASRFGVISDDDADDRYVSNNCEVSLPFICSLENITAAIRVKRCGEKIIGHNIIAQTMQVDT